jgi:hypothetical protein
VVQASKERQVCHLAVEELALALLVLLEGKLPVAEELLARLTVMVLLKELGLPLLAQAHPQAQSSQVVLPVEW